MGLVLVGAERPAAAGGATVVSGVAVFSPGVYVGLSPVTWPPGQAITMTETQQGLFVAGFEAQVASLACTFTGFAQEEYALGSAVLVGSCTGRGVTGVQVSKSCNRAYTRLAQWLVVTESCRVQVGSSIATTSTATNHVAQLPPPPTDRYYYTGTAIELLV
jgi:hypothetical protein